MKKLRRKSLRQPRFSPRMAAARARTKSLQHSPCDVTPSAATNDNAATDRRLDQYYTRSDVATALYHVFRQRFDPAGFLMVEPSAGTGAFFRLMPPGSLAWDVDPKYPGIVTADFLTVTIPTGRRIAVVGNPPFGRTASMAVRFFNHAARQAEVVAFIVPCSFRKAAIENRLDLAFHLIHETPVPPDAFLFRGQPYSVPAVFQIWQRGATPRALRRVETSHPDFSFTTPDMADFAIHRVGARAGQVHHKMTASPSSNYFIKANTPNVEAVMRRLDFASVVGNVAGNPSLAKSEIVALYKAYI